MSSGAQFHCYWLETCATCSKDVYEFCGENSFVICSDFFQLYEHMADCHYVCKLCSNPAEAKVVSFLDEQDQAIHTAAEHSDGTIRPDVLFNFQQRGAERLKARQRRGGEDRLADEVENQVNNYIHQ